MVDGCDNEEANAVGESVKDTGVLIRLTRGVSELVRRKKFFCQRQTLNLLAIPRSGKRVISTLILPIITMISI